MVVKNQIKVPHLSTKGDVDPNGTAAAATQKETQEQLSINNNHATSGGKKKKKKYRGGMYNTPCLNSHSNHFQVPGNIPGEDNFGNDALQQVKHGIETYTTGLIHKQHDNIKQTCKGTVGGSKRKKGKSRKKSKKRRKSKRKTRRKSKRQFLRKK